jgi:hypothetical protein
VRTLVTILRLLWFALVFLAWALLWVLGSAVALISAVWERVNRR